MSRNQRSAFRQSLHPVAGNPMKPPRKILAIQFKSLGDAIMVIPSLEAIRKHYPDCELHALVPDSSAPLFQHHPALTKVWVLPRVRGRARIKNSWPVLRAVRAERFDRSVDFCGNDRGAILSLLSGAPVRLGVFQPGGFFGRRFCYTRAIPAAPQDRHETLRLAHILSAWDIPTPAALKLSLFTDPSLQPPARALVPNGSIICHTGAAQSKKEWPIEHWAALHRIATAAGLQLVFSRGVGRREENSLERLKKILPEAKILPPLNIAEFIAVIKESRGVISNDTGPMHFAAALGVPMVALFGPTSVLKWAPLSDRVRILRAEGCTCRRTVHDCESAVHCMTRIVPETVFQSLVEVLRTRHR
ncbi:MAG TPA: glycosyltransferase family 9 protein [Verrucomicrobiae bacterium]